MKGTRDRLTEAAAQAFNTTGFHGTDTNRIARAAGYAPQTFYRHFTDKMDIFIAVYEGWQASEREALAKASRGGAAPSAMARILIEYHARWKVFRRSLRLLAVEDDKARAARTASRERQLVDLMRLPGNAGRNRADLFAALLRVERLCDAAADGEFADQGIAESIMIASIAAAVAETRPGGSHSDRAGKPRAQ